MVPNLLHLDISKCDKLNDISCLRGVPQLEVLLMHGIRLDIDGESIIDTLKKLKKLRVLDLSDKRSDYHSDR